MWLWGRLGRFRWNGVGGRLAGRAEFGQIGCFFGREGRHRWQYGHRRASVLARGGQQVLPDFHGRPKNSMGKLGRSAKKKWQARFRSFVKSNAARRGASGPDLQQVRLSNKYHCLAFDGALKLGTSLDCAAFVAPAPPKPLAAGDTRFFVPIEKCPVPVQRASADRTRRSCIIGANDKSRLEVRWGGPRRVLHQHLDAGSSNLGNKLWMYT